MFTLTTEPHGPVNDSPPAKGIFSTVLWQPQPRLTRYLPRASESAPGPGTGSLTGSGTLRTNKFTGTLIFAGDRGLRTGGNERRNTTTGARSSSERFLYSE